MRLSTLLAIGLATTLSAGAAVNTTALQNQLRSLNEAKQNTLQLLNSGKINQATADQRISVLDADIMRAAAAGEGTWVPTLEIVKNADGVPTSKIERKYDDKAQIIEAKYYLISDGDEESAYPYNVSTYAYDEAGNTTLHQVLYYWNGPEKPSSGNKYEYAYNTKGNMTKDYYYFFDPFNEKWITSSMSEYGWDAKGDRQIMSQTISNPDQDGKFLSGSKSEQAYDAEGNQILYISYNWNVEEQKFVVSNKTENSFTKNNRQTFYAFYRLINNELTLYDTWTKTFDANDYQTSYESMTWNGTELVGQQKWERARNDNGEQTLDASYNWENGKWLPASKTTTEYGEEFITQIAYSGWKEEWIPYYKSETPVRGWNQANYYRDYDKEDWYLTSNTMTLKDANWDTKTEYNLFYNGETVNGVRQYSGTKTEYTYGSDSGAMKTVYEWDNETQDWGRIIEISGGWSSEFYIDSKSTTGINEWGKVDNNGQNGYKTTEFYRTGTLIWKASYTWDAEKQEFVEDYKDEYKYTLDDNGNVATREIYRNGELFSTTYYFYTEVGGTTGVDDVAAAGSFKVSGNTITFGEATNVAVYTIDGKMVHNGVTESLTLDAGNVYILKGEGWNKKIAL